MKIRKMYEYKDSEATIEEPIGTLALVVRMPISQMPEGIRLIQGVPGTRVIYQRTSVGRLKIVADD